MGGAQHATAKGKRTQAELHCKCNKVSVSGRESVGCVKFVTFWGGAACHGGGGADAGGAAESIEWGQGYETFCFITL